MPASLEANLSEAAPGCDGRSNDLLHHPLGLLDRPKFIGGIVSLIFLILSGFSYSLREVLLDRYNSLEGQACYSK